MFSRRYFQLHFLEWKCLNFECNLTKFVPKGPINNNTTLFQIMAWRWTGNKPLSEPMMVMVSDAYMRHPALSELKSDLFSSLAMGMLPRRLWWNYFHSVTKKLRWFIRHLSDALYISYSNLWNLPSDIWAKPSEMSDMSDDFCEHCYQ